MFKRWMGIAVLAMVIGACGSKKKVEDTAAVPPGESADTQSTPGVENTPLSFDVQGSDGGKISGLESLRFEYDKASLGDEAKRIAKVNAEWMKAHPSTQIQIEGHCDARGSIEYNLSLGERRAKTVKDYMVSLGVAEKRISILSYGKEKPLSNGDSESDHAKNRRANFVPLN